jgi:CRISPR/Cas system CSM-associated protein Csm2 small subunit
MEEQEKLMRALKESIKNCNDIDALMRLSDDFHDLLIEIVALLRKNGMKTKLTKVWADLISE